MQAQMHNLPVPAGRAAMPMPTLLSDGMILLSQVLADIACAPWMEERHGKNLPIIIHSGNSPIKVNQDVLPGSETLFIWVPIMPIQFTLLLISEIAGL